MAFKTLEDIVQQLANRMGVVEGRARAIVPVGSLHMFAGGSIPDGFLDPYGQAVSRTTYAALFAVLGTQYGAGNGTTTFNLPNMKGRAPVGVDPAQPEFATLGAQGGAKTHTLTVLEMPAHKHTLAQTNGSGGGSTRIATGPGPTSSTNDTDMGSTGGGVAHNNLQPYTAIRFLIKF